MQNVDAADVVQGNSTAEWRTSPIVIALTADVNTIPDRETIAVPIAQPDGDRRNGNAGNVLTQARATMRVVDAIRQEWR